MESVSDLILRVNKAGAEVSLYYGVVVTRPKEKLSPSLHAEILKRSKEIRAYLASRLAAARSGSQLAHKWVIRLGDLKTRTNGAVRPAYLACGPYDWCQKLVRQSQELSDPANKYERARWLILEQEQVGGISRNERGILVATEVALPEEVELGGPGGSNAEILSVCQGCLVPPLSAEKTAEIVKNDD